MIVANMEAKVRAIPAVQQEVASTSRELSHLRDQVEQLQQRSRINNLEIDGVHVGRGENVLELVYTIFGILKVGDRSLIQVCHGFST